MTEQERVYRVEESDSRGKGQRRLKTVDGKDSECAECVENECEETDSGGYRQCAQCDGEPQ